MTNMLQKKFDKKASISPPEIITYYNNIFSVLINYYRGTERLSDLYDFLFILKRSAALTISNFYRKRSAKWAFNKYGFELTIPLPEVGKKKTFISLIIPSLTKRTGKN